jgi:hypothetical protein
MKKSLIILLCILANNRVDGQIVEWKHETKSKIQLPNSESIITNQRIGETKSLGFTPSSKDEKLLMIKGVVSYSMYYTGPNEKWKVSKKVNGSEIVSTESDVTGTAEVINDDGYLVMNDFSHGAGAVFMFYDPNLKKLNQYQPFTSTYKMTQVGGYNNRIAIYSLKQTNDKNCKLALFDKEGNLLVEKNYDIGGVHIATKVKVTTDKVLLFVGDYNATTHKYSTRIIAFDFNLNQIWSNTYNSVIGYNVAVNIARKNISFEESQKIVCLSLDNGQVKWIVSESSIDNSNLAHGFNAAYTEDGQNLIVNISQFNKDQYTFNENTIAILDTESGKIKYKQAQGPSKNPIDILALTKGFLIVKDNEIIEFNHSEK